MQIDQDRGHARPRGQTGIADRSRTRAGRCGGGDGVARETGIQLGHREVHHHPYADGPIRCQGQCPFQQGRSGGGIVAVCGAPTRDRDEGARPRRESIRASSLRPRSIEALRGGSGILTYDRDGSRLLSARDP